jgi:hypothetical protein
MWNSPGWMSMTSSKKTTLFKHAPHHFAKTGEHNPLNSAPIKHLVNIKKTVNNGHKSVQMGVPDAG